MRSRNVAMMLLVVVSVLADYFLVLQPTFATPIQISQQLSWGSILSGLSRRKRPMASRGEICILSPAELEKIELVMETQPAFLWQGQAGAIALRRSGETQPFWREATNKRVEQIQVSSHKSTIRRFQYTGKPLQTGVTYDMLLFDLSTTPYPKARQSFQVISKARRAQVVADLNLLNLTLKSKGFSNEQISLYQVNNLISQRLWSDAIQKIYSVKNPSFELSKVALDIPVIICNQSALPVDTNHSAINPIYWQYSP